MNKKGDKYKVAHFRFYAELNDFLPKSQKQVRFSYHFYGPLRVQEAILSMRIPLSEVDLILINGLSQKPQHLLKDGDYVSIYPVFETIDISCLTKLRPKPLRHTLFILDVHLGKLAKYLRMAGFDTHYNNQIEDAEIIDISIQTGRIILTRDKDLLRSAKVKHGYFVRSTSPRKQFIEIINKFDLTSQFSPLIRCLECNHLLTSVQPSKIKDQLDTYLIQHFNTFYSCEKCGRIYWKGSHYKRMVNYINHLKVKLKSNKTR
jgi:uncharacterized protein with PIN domain